MAFKFDEKDIEGTSKLLPVGSLVAISGTGSVPATIYRIVKHFPPGSFRKVNKIVDVPIEGKKKGGRTQRRMKQVATEQLIWSIQVESVLQINFSNPNRPTGSKTTYPLRQVRLLTVMELLKIRTNLDDVLRHHIQLRTEEVDVATESEVENVE